MQHTHEIEHFHVDRDRFMKNWLWASENNRISREPFLAVCLYPDCPDRRRPFTSREEIEEHIDKIHTKGAEKPFVCAHPDCYQWFAHPGSARRHHECKKRGLVFHCNLCEKSFNRDDARRVHEQTCARSRRKNKEKEINMSLSGLNTRTPDIFYTSTMVQDRAPWGIGEYFTIWIAERSNFRFTCPFFLTFHSLHRCWSISMLCTWAI